MLKSKLLALKVLLIRRPKLLIVISFVVFLLLLVGFECFRARMYLQRVEDYKQSVSVLQLKDSIQKMSKLAEDDKLDPVLCELEIKGSIVYQNIAYAESSKNDRLDLYIEEVQDNAERVLPSPQFSSLLIFLPRVSEARSQSTKLKEATEQIKYLTSEDKRSQYCLALVEMLSEIYFVSDLKAPQGVGALRVGQIENFQVDVDQAQEALRNISPPSQFVGQHILINDFLNDLRVDLRLSTNDIDGFAREIDKGYEVLSAILIDIGYNSPDLRQLPERVLLYSAHLN